MNDMIVGVDLAKAVFQLHGATTDGKLVFRKKVPRQHVIFRAELTRGDADKNLDRFYVARPRLSRYSIGLRPPSDILMRVSLYQRI